MRRYTLVLASIFVALVFAIVWFGVRPTDERTQLVFSDSRGTVTSGAKLGIAVGDRWTEADAALRRLFRPEYVLWQTGVCAGDGRDGQIGRAPVLVGRAQVSYKDRSWRNGVVVLCLQDGVVTSIGWHYPGPFYIDI